jgi:hypothetical protein
VDCTIDKENKEHWSVQSNPSIGKRPIRIHTTKRARMSLSKQRMFSRVALQCGKTLRAATRFPRGPTRNGHAILVSPVAPVWPNDPSSYTQAAMRRCFTTCLQRPFHTWRATGEIALETPRYKVLTGIHESHTHCCFKTSSTAYSFYSSSRKPLGLFHTLLFWNKFRDLHNKYPREISLSSPADLRLEQQLFMLQKRCTFHAMCGPITHRAQLPL